MQDRFSLLSYDQDELRSTTGADLDAVLAGVVNSSSRAQETGEAGACNGSTQREQHMQLWKEL